MKASFMIGRNTNIMKVVSYHGKADYLIQKTQIKAIGGAQGLLDIVDEYFNSNFSVKLGRDLVEQAMLVTDGRRKRDYSKMTMKRGVCI